jgi:hypothetical protein
MPTIELGLSRNGSYVQEGTPENASPYDGTAVKLPGRARPASKPKPAAKPKAKPTPKPVAKPKPKPAAKPRPKPKLAARPAAFNVVGAPAEPLDEMPLPARAERLERWLRAHPKPTNANVRYWLFQHEWIVTGARFGWWHGAEALETLVRVDQRVQSLWGIGGKSEAVARAALTEVRSKSR